MRVDYHFHTGRSYDASSSPDAVLEAAARAGLDVLCVTDHDTIEGALELARVAPRAIRVVIGCEFTCEDGSHLVGLGLADMIAERRVLPLMERIRAQGGLVLLPHLFRRGSGIFRNELRRPEGFVRDVLARADLVECFNGRDTYENNARSLRFALDRDLPSVASSDAHRPAQIGSVFVEYDAGDARDGSSARRVWFPSQRPAREPALKRRALELFHRHRARLPGAVDAAYRLARAALERDDADRGLAPARLQYALPPAPARREASGG